MYSIKMKSVDLYLFFKKKKNYLHYIIFLSRKRLYGGEPIFDLVNKDNVYSKVKEFVGWKSEWKLNKLFMDIYLNV